MVFFNDPPPFFYFFFYFWCGDIVNFCPLWGESNFLNFGVQFTC